MNCFAKLTLPALLAAAIGVPVVHDKALAQEKREADVKLAPLPTSPEWQKLKTLVGEWKCTFEQGDKKTESSLEVRMTADGSALMHWMDKGTSHEMVTMIHPDGPRLMATHYCAAHNQPRLEMIAAPGPNQIAFQFKDGTNIEPGAGHMQKLVITFVDAAHHDAAWTYREKGKDTPPAIFRYTRVK